AATVGDSCRIPKNLLDRVSQLR
ncbi:hypothetical protein Tco_0398961, partial [Tanacetum coccineum]